MQENNDITWGDNGEPWESSNEAWNETSYVTYETTSSNTLFTAGEYVVLANEKPYRDVLSITGITETVADSGVGTIMKKEFRYSTDSQTFSEFAELTNAALTALGSFDIVFFQFRYILLSGGPVTVSKVEIVYTKKPDAALDTYEAPAQQDESRVYAFPIIYKSNFLWEPYRMNRAIRLYKDLNLMVNSLFGHDTLYYRVLPQGRSKDVFLMEYSLFEHEESKCVKVVVPNNEFPDNKLNMGPFGVDFELPFEVQIDKDYFQKIFGEGSGPQKRDVLFFPRTNRVYEVSSSYLFRDFMNEPLYFKVTLIKWLPKSNVEQSETVTNLQDYTVSAGGLFGEIKKDEETKITDPQQFTVATTKEDPVRKHLSEEMQIREEALMNYHTLVSEFHYDMGSLSSAKRIHVDVDTTYLEKGATYYVRRATDSVQPDIQLYYSMKKLIYEGKDDDGLAIFTWSPGGSQVEAEYPLSVLFKSTEYFLYEKEYDGETPEEYAATCDTQQPAKFYGGKPVKYLAKCEFKETQDLSFSSWFRIQNNTNPRLAITFTFDPYSREMDITLERPMAFLVGDGLSVTRASSTSFNLFATVTQVISPTRIRAEVSLDIYNFIEAAHSGWSGYGDLGIQRSFPHVFVSSLDNSKGIEIVLYESRYFEITMNSEVYKFYIPSNTSPLEKGTWYAIFVNFSNSFKQLTLNIWKLQWNPVTKLPATTDLKLAYNKTVPISQVDRSSGVNYWLETSYMDLTNVRIFNRVAETDKQVLVLNQNIVKDAHLALVIDNALPQQKSPYIGYTR